MFSKITVALLAVTLLAVPAMAQSTMVSPRAPATQPVKIPALKSHAAMARVHDAHAIKVVKVKKHKHKKLKVAKHAVHGKHVVHAKHLTFKRTEAKPLTPSHQN